MNRMPHNGKLGLLNTVQQGVQAVAPSLYQVSRALHTCLVMVAGVQATVQHAWKPSLLIKSMPSCTLWPSTATDA